jgi:hypothetical protein
VGTTNDEHEKFNRRRRGNIPDRRRRLRRRKLKVAIAEVLVAILGGAATYQLEHNNIDHDYCLLAINCNVQPGQPLHPPQQEPRYER